MFDVQEEYEPGGDGYYVLDHCPGAYRHHRSEFAAVEASRFVESVLLSVTADAGVEYEEDEGYEFGEAGSDCCSCNAEGRESKVAEDEYPVEEYV